MATVYVSDTHFAHANIIKYCSRPFATVEEMNLRMLLAIRAADDAGHRIIHAGDLCYGRGKESWRAMMQPLRNRDQHKIVLGNHDHGLRDAEGQEQYGRWFGEIVGMRVSWRSHSLVVEDELFGKPVRVLVSHKPQRRLGGCDFNVYGHVHNSLWDDAQRLAARQERNRHREEEPDDWAARSQQHLCACVEVTEYQALPLEELLAVNRKLVPV